MSERFSWTELKLCHYNYDLQRDWFIYFTITDHETGISARKQFRGGINAFKTVNDRTKQSNALIAYWKQELKGGWNPFNPDDQPVTNPFIYEAYDHILELKTATCGARTIDSYAYVIKLFKNWLKDRKMDNLFLYQFTKQHAQSYMDWLTLKKGYCNRTFNDHLVILATFNNCMVDRDWLAKSPFRKIKKLPVSIGRNIAFSDKEQEELKNYLWDKDRNMFYFTQFVYYCFIRRSELTRLKIENIDWTNMSIIIPSSASKNKKQESVVIPHTFISTLSEMKLQDHKPEDYIFGRYMKPGPVQYINYNHISSRHNTICHDLGIDKEKGLYSWKHSGVCKLYPELNGDMYALMRQLRHSELTTTQIYLKSLGLVDNTAIRNAKW